MLQTKQKVLVIGEVFTDVHLDMKDTPLRLGGVFHSARALAALERNYALACIAPSYLTKSIKDYGEQLNASNTLISGHIDNASNVMLIQESTESGSQGYNDILREQANTTFFLEELNQFIQDYQPTDIIIYPGKFNLTLLKDTITNYKGRLHVDFQYGEQIEDEFLNELKFYSVIFSTTSSLFKQNDYSIKPAYNVPILNSTRFIVLKENRGGSTLYDVSSEVYYEAPAFSTETVHSVGVGDCFNSIFISLNNGKEIQANMKVAAFISMLYASTFNYNEFQELVKNLDFEEIKNMEGNRISWLDRAQHHIYIAGPDFPENDTTFFEQIFNDLTYHNFKPHRPIIENGLIDANSTEEEEIKAYDKDINLLNNSSLLIAVIINDDPGTYVEIGWMAKSNKPIILFDPYYKVQNLFLRKSANYIVHSRKDLIDIIFNILSRKNETKNNYDCLLLASGGLDSTVLAHKLLKEEKKILPIFLNYGQHFMQREYEALIEVLPKELIPHVKIIDISDIYKSSLSKMIIEPNLWEEIVVAEDLYLPYRNLLFLSLAASIAQSNEIKEVYSAFINSNHAKEIDCSIEFFDTLTQLLKSYGSVQIKMPFRNFSKAEVVDLGVKMKVPIAKTYSCQTNSKIPCGVCPNCVDRLEGLEHL